MFTTLYINFSDAQGQITGVCHNSVANLRKTTIYKTNVDLVKDDEHTKFGLILPISSHEKPNSDINQGP